MSETIMNHLDDLALAANASKEEEERMYKQGLQDYVGGNRESVEARYFVAYTVYKEVGELAVTSSAE